MSSAGQLKSLYETYGDDVEFFLVYIREAHPIDGERPGYRILVEQPITNLERQALATTCIADLDLGGIPALLDRIDDTTSHAYAAHPDRLYLVGSDGKIAYSGAKGPAGFHPEELEVAILYELGRGAEVADGESTSPPRQGPETGAVAFVQVVVSVPEGQMAVPVEQIC